MQGRPAGTLFMFENHVGCEAGAFVDLIQCRVVVFGQECVMASLDCYRQQGGRGFQAGSRPKYEKIETHGNGPILRSDPTHLLSQPSSVLVNLCMAVSCSQELSCI